MSHPANTYQLYGEEFLIIGRVKAKLMFGQTNTFLAALIKNHVFVKGMNALNCQEECADLDGMMDPIIRLADFL